MCVLVCVCVAFRVCVVCLVCVWRVLVGVSGLFGVVVMLCDVICVVFGLVCC